MNVVKEFSLSMANKPGMLANICKTLAEKKVNIISFTISDSTNLGMLRIVVDKPDMARPILSRLHSDISETEVLSIDMPNRPGALAGIAEKLSRAHININYAYATTSGPKAITVLKVQYPGKAAEVLKTPERQNQKLTPVRTDFRKY